MESRRRLSNHLTGSANKLRLNKILKIDGISKKSKKEAFAKQISRVALSELLKNTPAKTAQDLPDFKQFLSHPENVKEFRDFLKTQYCQENIDFYLACDKFRQLNPEGVGKELIKFMATQIYNDYLAESARQPINIDYECVKRIRDNMRDPKPDLLSDAQMEIFNLMRTDCYPRFCKTWQLDRNLAQTILSDKGETATPVNWTPTSIRSASISLGPDHVFATPMESCNRSQSSKSTSSSVSTRSTVSSMSASIRSSKSTQATQLNSVCPKNCPYLMIGLPCQQHDAKLSSRDEMDDLIDKVDLRRFHHVPNCRRIRRTPPPPPLPPKPEWGPTVELREKPTRRTIEDSKQDKRSSKREPTSVSPVGSDQRYYPYVGKVFNV